MPRLGSDPGPDIDRTHTLTHARTHTRVQCTAFIYIIQII